MTRTQDALQELWAASEASLDPASTFDFGAGDHLRFVLHQTFHYRYAGPVASLKQRLVVVPPVRYGPQRRTYQRILLQGAEGRVSWSRDAFANCVTSAYVPSVGEWVEFQVDAIVERAGTPTVRLPTAALRARKYLGWSPFTKPDEALSTAAHDVAGAARSVVEAAERLCALVHQLLPYQKGVTSVGTTASEALRGAAGVCQDHAHVMIAMCRALGIPARYVSGHMLGEGSTHAWVEVILPDPQDDRSAIALPFDPCHGRKPDATYLTVAVGRDYGDVAPASGTYEGGFSNELVSATRLGVSLASEATG